MTTVYSVTGLPLPSVTPPSTVDDRVVSTTSIRPPGSAVRSTSSCSTSRPRYTTRFTCQGVLADVIS
jgi:hypothetical protein